MKKFIISEYEKGQDTAEYMLVLIGIVVLVVAAIFFRKEIWAFIGSEWQNYQLEQHQSTVDVQGVGEITIGKITIIDESLVSIIGFDEIELPNCNGSSELTVLRELEKSVQQNIQYTNATELSLDVSRLLIDISAQLYEALSIESTSEIHESTTIEVSAAPGTSVTYTINWVETEQVGTVEVIQADETHIVEFIIPSALQADILEPVNEGCE